MRKSNFFAILRSRDFALFSISQTVSQFGDRLDHMALIAMLRIYAEGSTIAFSNLAFFFTLPVILFGPVSGIFVDWWDRKKVMVLCDSTRALLVLSIPFLVKWTGSILPAYGIIFFVFLLGLFFNSSKMAILPGLIKDKSLLMAANSVNNFIGRISTVFGMLLGGLIVDWGLWSRFGIKGYEAGFYLDAITYFISATMLALIRVKREDRKKEIQDVGHIILEKEKNFFKQAFYDLKEALKLIAKDKNITFVLYSIGVLVFMGASIYVLIVILIQQILGYGTTGVGKLGALAAVGMMTGSFLTGTFAEKWNRKKIILLGFLTISILLFLFPFIERFYLLGIVSLLGGVVLSPIMISQDTLLHETVPTFFRGRIFSTKELTVNGSFLLFAYPLGVLAEIFHPQPMIIAAAIILAFLTAIVFFKTRNNL